MKTLVLGILIAVACRQAEANDFPETTFKAGDRIINAKNETGTILDIFENGTARISYDGWTPFFRAELRQLTLATASKCFKNICRNDRVMDSKNQIGRVLETFQNGQVRVMLDFEARMITSKAQDLNRSVKCLGEVCVGSKFTDRKEFPGQLLEIFENGKAQVHYTGWDYAYIRTLRELGIELTCVPKTTCPLEKRISLQN